MLSLRAVIIILTIFLYGCRENPTIPFSFRGKDLCNDLNGYPIELLTEEKVNLHGDRIHEIKQISRNDSVIFSFKLISDCCRKPSDSIIISDRQIIIFPKFTGALCDCHCEYYFEYSFLKKDLESKEIKVLEQNEKK